MNKPEQLFPGVEWEILEDESCFEVEFAGMLAQMHLDPIYGWRGRVPALEMGKSHPEQADTIAWLRARIIEHRDELCRVTKEEK